MAKQHDCAFHFTLSFSSLAGEAGRPKNEENHQKTQPEPRWEATIGHCSEPGASPSPDG